MQEKFSELRNRAKSELELVASSRFLNDLKVKFVGKNGEVTALLRGMKDVPADQRASFGKMVNDLKVEIEALFNQKEEVLKEKELNLKMLCLDILPKKLF